MHIVEFTAGSLRFIEQLPEAAPADGFVWVYLDRSEFVQQQALLQGAMQRLGGSALLDVHLSDLINDAHPSHYDGTSVYDLVIFRRLATLAEVQHETTGARHHDTNPRTPAPATEAFARIESRAVGFAIFDRLLISVHPAGCYTATHLIQRLAADAKLSVEAASTRSRVPHSPADVALRIINHMVDSYLDLRKDLTAALEQSQTELLKPDPHHATWDAIMHARRQLQLLEDLCEEQHDAMQEWLDSLAEQPLALMDARLGDPQAQRDQLVARARDVIEHIQRVIQHVRRLENSAETVVQIHFSVQGNRTNDIMRVLTTLTAIFLPLNLIAGIFGMNFHSMPLLHLTAGFWIAIGTMLVIALLLSLWFWRKHYLHSED